LDRIVVTDTITLDNPVSELGMNLDLNLAPSVTPLEKGVTKELIAAPGLVVLKREKPTDKWSLSYEGSIDYPLTQVGEEYARGQKETVGTISPEGVYLAAGSGWYPRVHSEEKVTFQLDVRLPAGWDVISQGARKYHRKYEEMTVASWACDQPQEGIWLVAGQYHEYSKKIGKVQAMAFFRKPEDALAKKYLAATGEFISMYEKLIGPYPYGKFALVENFWETGYGMPSFTLLGPRVIRFPFIIESSYPHEILHNWWGNTVYIDYESGNWGEGLTAYLSDHLLKEQKGLGVQHRQESLQKYADYVLSERDLPLTAFRSRHGSVSEAVGYGKTMMLFHMLRLELGDDLFRKGLQRFYSENLYKTAGFEDVQAAFETVSDQSLEWFFDQWISRMGAPVLTLEETMVTQLDDGTFGLSLVINQTQPDSQAGGPSTGSGPGRREEALRQAQGRGGGIYKLKVPVAVTIENEETVHLELLEMTEARQTFTANLPGRPLRVDVDPKFDLFRRLDRREIPSALTQAFGAEKAVIVLPTDAPSDLLDSYRSLAKSLTRTGPGIVKVTDDGKLADLPTDSSVWLVGWENRLLEKVLPAFNEYGTTLDRNNGTVEIPGQVPVELSRGENSVVLTGRHPGNLDLAVLWIAADNHVSHEGLARKLPHYHKYSFLGFTGDAPDNMAKGRWPVINSPLTSVLTDQVSVPMGKIPGTEPLIDRPVPFSSDRMMEDIHHLASEEMKGRGLGSEELDRAGEYIAGQMEKAGLQPGGEDGSWLQEWTVDGSMGPMTMKNVVAVIPGSRSEWEGQSVVVGAHYDHLGLGLGDGGLAINKGKVHPGADDNASGVAVMLELAKVLNADFAPQRSIVFVAFTGEETGKLGSEHYVKNPGQYQVGKAMGMVNLDTVGRLGDGKILVLGGDSAEEWIHIYRGAGYVTGVDLQVVKKSIDASDHLSFIDAGVPATQLFTGAHVGYHKPSDTVDKIDPGGLVKVAAVAKQEAGGTLRQAQGRGAKKAQGKFPLGLFRIFLSKGRGYGWTGRWKEVRRKKQGCRKVMSSRRSVARW
jgi:hypothetical protein